MNQKMTGSVVHLFTYNEERADRYVRSLFSDGTMGAYAIRPYTDGRKTVTILIRLASDMFIRGAYAIRPYPDGRKIVMILIRSASDMSIRGTYAIRPYPDGQKIATILIRLPHSNLKIATILIH